METERQVTIYALCEPDTNEIRYIGQSVNPNARIKSHITNSFTGTTQRDKWIRSLLVKGKLPVLRTISVVGLAEANAAESQAIKQAKLDGAKLVNATEGANGGSNHGKRTERPESVQVTFDVPRRTAEIIERYASQYGNKNFFLMLLVDRFAR